MPLLETLVDDWDDIRNFEYVRLGPGVYLLIDGRFCWGNVVYIGRTVCDILMRVGEHKNKLFTKVAVILPACVNEQHIVNIESLVMLEYLEKYSELPHYNKVMSWGSRYFSVRQMARRREDVEFL